MFQEKSCGAVVFIKKDAGITFLLLHYEAGHWDFVKGNMEPGESERDTVLRELQEETGIIDAEFIEGFREKVEYFYRRQGATIHKQVIFYLIETRMEEIKISYEHVGYTWVNYEQAMEKLTFKNAKDVLQKAHEFLITQGKIKPAG
ncbi:MAG: NUDIX domain-containing protein [Candidatus Bathyarchaeota archaeon]|nr:NUDIX domain-containing protein [Candidatus Bathyarchaeota archaeon]